MEKIIVDDKIIEYDLSSEDKKWKVKVGENEEKTFMIEKRENYYVISDENERKFMVADIYKGKEYTIIWIEDKEITIKEFSEEETKQEEEGEANIKSTMPGVIKEIKCEEGQKVKKGDTLVIFESMKVLNELKANVDGTVKKIHASEGDQVGPLELLVEIEKEE